METLIGWARVSGASQDLDQQIEALKEAGCKKVFSGKHSGKAEANAKALAEMLDYVREGDTLVVTKLDRLGRSLRQVLEVVENLTQKGVTLRALHDSIDTSKRDPMNMAMLQLLAMFAEMERRFIVERTTAGKIASGNFGGRKPKLSDAEKKLIKEKLSQGESKSSLARSFGVSRATIMRAGK